MKDSGLMRLGQLSSSSNDISPLSKSTRIVVVVRRPNVDTKKVIVNGEGSSLEKLERKNS